MSKVEVIPSAKRLIESLRDTGYEFSQAVADVVDNSIEAKAKFVKVDVQFAGDDSIVRIIDNGRGMRPDQLIEAMRYGANRTYESADLGKFGLGLKTASMSQCQRLSVCSRWNPDRANVVGYSWDLNHISKTNRWEILALDRDAVKAVTQDVLQKGPGTVVAWEQLDRILGYQHPHGERAIKRLRQMCRDTEDHLSMVFHRFLAGERGCRKVKMTLNDNDVTPWDPFCQTHPKTDVLKPTKIPINYEGIEGEVLIEPYLLPNQKDFETPEQHTAAGGPARWNNQQGLYIYRANRIIQSGGWSGLVQIDEHTKLARIAMSFLPALDDAFKVNVAKMRVQLPGEIRDELKALVSNVRGLAKKKYDNKSSPTIIVGKGASTVSKLPATLVGQVTPDTTTRAPTEHLAGTKIGLRLTMAEWSDRLIAVTRPEEECTVRAVIDRARSANGYGNNGDTE